MDPNAPLTMTLAGLAYASPAFIRSHLAAGPVGGVRWELAWIADALDEPVNFAFLVRDPAAERYVLAIRGTYPVPFTPAYFADGQQDFPIGPMHGWPYGDAPAAAQVSGGSWTGFTNLLALSGAGVTLADALNGLAGGELIVTGHSLGGTLAPLVALWFTTQSTLSASVYAFAGMTPGNAAFAALFGPGSALAGRVWRYSNDLDTVAYGWDRVRDTVDFYQPRPQGGQLVGDALKAMAEALVPYGYTAIGEEIVLNGTLRSYGGGWEFLAYLFENLHQHLPDTYLALLGAEPLPFTLGYGPVVDERAGGGAMLRTTPVFRRVAS